VAVQLARGPALRAHRSGAARAGEAGRELLQGRLPQRSGEAAYEVDDATFVKRFHPEPDAEHADGGANVEVYVCDELIELETLSPLRVLPPGGRIEHVEEWELRA
jgi:hypothetical protein